MLCEANWLFIEGYFIEGRRNRGAKGEETPPRFLLIHWLFFNQGGQILPTILIIAPPPRRILRPSQGPVHFAAQERGACSLYFHFWAWNFNLWRKSFWHTPEWIPGAIWPDLFRCLQHCRMKTINLKLACTILANMKVWRLEPNDLHWNETYASTLVNIRRLMGSTDQADPSCIYFRISWILKERPWFYFFCPLHLLRGLRSTNIK